MVPFFNWCHPFHPAIVLLLKKSQALTIVQHKLAALIFIAAQQSIVKTWHTPTVQLHEVKTPMFVFLNNAKKFALLNDKMQMFEKQWSSWIQAILPHGFDNRLFQMSRW